MNYKELLKSPLWQKKRLQILNRDKFACRHCKKDDRQLQVHHKRYLPGRFPWEYADSDLITLCDECHRIVKVINLEKETNNTWKNAINLDLKTLFICTLKMIMRKLTFRNQHWIL